MTLPTLIYFKGTGRAEPIRLALYMSGIDFKDERVTNEEFARRKPEFPAGQLPAFVTEDGDLIGESAAILRYVGKLGGLYPKTNPLVAAKVDEALDMVDDLLAPVPDTIFMKDEEERKQKRQELQKTHIPTFLTAIEEAWKQNGTKFLATDEVSVADLRFYAIVQMLPNFDYFEDVLAEGYDDLRELFDRIGALPKVAEWNAKVKGDQYKLCYLDIKARAGAIRNAFKVAGIEFSEERLSFPEFGAAKEKFRSKQVPVLYINGGKEELYQSNAILRYIGNIGGLYPSDPKEALYVDEIVELVHDGNNAIMWTVGMKDREAMLKKRAEISKGKLAEIHASIEKALEKRKVKALNIGDLALQVYVEMLTTGSIEGVGEIEGLPTDLLDGFKNIRQCYEETTAILANSAPEEKEAKA